MLINFSIFFIHIISLDSETESDSEEEGGGGAADGGGGVANSSDEGDNGDVSLSEVNFKFIIYDNNELKNNLCYLGL